MTRTEPLALMIVQELERLRQDITEMRLLIPQPRRSVQPRSTEVVAIQSRSARIRAPRKVRG
jgi:hypothetical protein